MTTPLRTASLAALLTTGLLLPGCNEKELAKLNEEKAQLQTELEAAKAAVETAESERAAARKASDQVLEELNAAKAELETAKDDLARLPALEKRVAEAGSASDQIEDLEQDKNMLESHRDELIEWVEELLPVAEANDPKLAALKKDAAEMAKAVERIRGLEFKRPFMRRLVKRASVGKAMKRDLMRDLPEDEAEALVAVAAEFGMIEPGTNLYDIFAEFLEAGAGAYYKPTTGTFYLIEGADGIGSRPIVFHELIHAVEDQHYDLMAVNERLEDDADAAMAFKGLTEGSADFFQELYHKENPQEVAAMMKDQMKPDLIQKQQAMLQKVPTFLIAMMGLYPYKNGSAFLRKIGVKGPAEAAKVWADPPVSTEQVLHPEKFSLDGTGRDYPHKLGELDLTGILPAWDEVDSANMGELMIGMSLIHLKHPEQGPQGLMGRMMAVMDMQTQGVQFKGEIAKAAGGWDGDRYTAMRHPETGQVCVVWSSVWDSEKDAEEFQTTFGKLIGKKATGQDVGILPQPVRFTAKNGTITASSRKGTRVVFVMGAPEDQLNDLMAVGETVEVTPDERDVNDAR